MADLVSHLALGGLYQAARRGTQPEFFVLGCALPDLCGRVPGVLLSAAMVRGIPIPEALVHSFTVLHMPAGFVPLCLVISLCVPEPERLGVWASLVGGSLLHLVVDLVQRHYGAGYMIFYPFSTWSWEAGWLGSEATVLWAPILALSALWSWRRRIGRDPSSNSCVD